MSTRLVITVRLDGLGITDGPGLAGLMTGQVIPDLEQLAGSAAEIGELKPGQYGWTSDPDTHDVRTHWAIRLDEPAQAEPAPGPRYVAHFTPEAWVNNQAIEVDSQGPQEWDCTAYATEDTGTSRGLHRLVYLDWLHRRAQTDLQAGLDGLEGVLDTDDVFRDDPAAPDWIRRHQGPCTIRIRREG